MSNDVIHSKDSKFVVSVLTSGLACCVQQEVTEWNEADHHSKSSGNNSRSGNSRALMQRQSTVRGRTQPLFRSLPDKSLMLRTSERPPMYYMALGKVSKTIHNDPTFCVSMS